MACVAKKKTLFVNICGLRHGHMVKLPGNAWSTKEWIKTPKKRWIPKKGTMFYKLDTIVPSDDLMHKTVDPKMEQYSYQLDAYPKTKNCDPLMPLCNLTRTAEPISLSSLNHTTNSACLSEFTSHVEECCDSFNRLLHQKNMKISKRPTPLQLDNIHRHYSAAFLQSILFFLFNRPETCGPLLLDSHISANVHTAAFWRYSIMQYKKYCHNFQFNNFIDLMVRSKRKLSYDQLRCDMNPTANTEWSVLENVLHDVCSKRLVLFKENRQVEQYPGFIKETIFPFNHTLFKVSISLFTNWYSIMLIFKTIVLTEIPRP